jgi:hypothetical protein
MILSNVRHVNRSDINNDYVQLEERKEDEDETIKNQKTNNLNNSEILESQVAKDLEKDDEALFKKFNTGHIRKTIDIKDFYNDIDI